MIRQRAHHERARTAPAGYRLGGEETTPAGGTESDEASLENAFYQRLLALKEQHKRTLESVEALYRDHVLKEEVRGHGWMACGDSSSENAGLETGPTTREASQAWPAHNEQVDSGGSEGWSCDVSMASCDQEAAGGGDMEEDAYGGEEEQEEEEEEDGLTLQAGAVDMINDMWSDFSIDDYKNLELPQQTGPPHSTWLSPNFTTPKPFSMTLRDEARAQSGLMHSSRCILEAERLRRQREAAEEAEMCCTFQARDVPRSTWEPRYEKLLQEEAKRRERVIAESEERLRASEKPFKFIKREKLLREQRTERALAMTAKQPWRANTSFCAKPVPRNIFARELTEKCLEEELYRQIRIRMRAEQMLASSQLPRSMDTRAKSRRYTVGELRLHTSNLRAQEAGLTRDHHFQPFINHTVPNFGELHRQLRQDLNREKTKRPNTVVQPFFLRTALLARSKKCSCNGDSHSHIEIPLSAKTRPPPPSTYVPDCDAGHSRSTSSTRLYHQSIQRKVNRRRRQEAEEAFNDSKKRAAQKSLSQQVSLSVLQQDNTPLLKLEAERKLHEFRSAIHSPQLFRNSS